MMLAPKALAYTAILIVQTYAATETAPNAGVPKPLSEEARCLRRERELIEKPVSTEPGLQNLEFNLCSCVPEHFWTQIFYDWEGKRKCIFLDLVSRAPGQLKYTAKHIDKLEMFKKHARSCSLTLNGTLWDTAKLRHVVHWNGERHCLDISLYLRLLLNKARNRWLASLKLNDDDDDAKEEFSETELLEVIKNGVADLSVAASTYGFIESFEKILAKLLPRLKGKYDKEPSEEHKMWTKIYKQLGNPYFPDMDFQKSRIESDLRRKLSELMVSTEFAETYPQLPGIPVNVEKNKGGIDGYVVKQPLFLAFLTSMRSSASSEEDDSSSLSDDLMKLCVSKDTKSLTEAVSGTLSLLEKSPIFDVGRNGELVALLVLADHIFRFYDVVGKSDWVSSLPTKHKTTAQNPRLCLAEIILRKYLPDLHKTLEAEINTDTADSASGG